jgi:hypothetical protein
MPNPASLSFSVTPADLGQRLVSDKNLRAIYASLGFIY